jgi:hypothetical protein
LPQVLATGRGKGDDADDDDNDDGGAQDAGKIK